MAEQLFQVGVKAVARNEAGDIAMVGAPQADGTPVHWDLPGGRMDPGETFIQTLHRELTEEIGITFEGEPQQLATILSNITIPVGSERFPLVVVVYTVLLPTNAVITFDPDGPEQAFEWVHPAEVAQRLARKYPSSFCDAIKEL